MRGINFGNGSTFICSTLYYSRARKVAVKGVGTQLYILKGPPNSTHRVKLQATLKAGRAVGTIRESGSKEPRLQQPKKGMMKHLPRM